MNDNLQNDKANIDDKVFNDTIEDMDDFPADMESELLDDIPSVASQPIIPEYIKDDIPHKSLGEKAADVAYAEGKMVEHVGNAMQTTGKGIEVTGKGVEVTGKGMQGVGKGVEKTGKGLSTAGEKMVDNGVELSSTGAGAIAGVPLAALGAVTSAAGKTTEIGGKAVETAGKGVEKTGKAVKQTGKNINESGKKVTETGQKITDVSTLIKDKKQRKRLILGKSGLGKNKDKPNNANNDLNFKKRKEHNQSKTRGNWSLMAPGKSTIQQKQVSSNNAKADKGKGSLTNQLKITITLGIILIAVLFLIFVILFIVINSFIWWDNTGSGGGSSTIGTSTRYTPKCTTMTVMKPDDSTATYNDKDYIAGVVAAEVGGFRNIEVYKAFAIAARTYGEVVGASRGCTINGDATAQSFVDISGSNEEYAKMIYQAVEETDNVVLTKKNQIFMSEYDAFCYSNKDSQKYILVQKKQQIPTDWVNSHITDYGYKNCACELNDTNQTDCWDSDGNWTDGGHGKGMSQYGALYLATEKGYDYKQILGYYYDDAELSSTHMTSVAGLDIKVTSGAKKSLDKPISEFLESNGSSLDEYNNFIKGNVMNAGVGTREAVVTAAVSMINFLYDNFDTKLPYYWYKDGNVPSGIPSTFGTYAPVQIDSNGNGNFCYYRSLDCSAFVSWAIKNGGYKFTKKTTSGFMGSFSGDSCDITNSNCIGQPGDLICSHIKTEKGYSGHVQMIVAVEEDNGKYYIAESGGAAVGIGMVEYNMHTPHSGRPTKILHMDSFYNNKDNVDQNY